MKTETIEEVRTIISEAAARHGFKYVKEGSYETIKTDWESYVSFRVCGYENREIDIETRTVTAEYKVTASVRKMGGEPTVEELLNAADEIKRAAELVAELDRIKLSYTQTF